jgi:hypothetical protein
MYVDDNVVMGQLASQRTWTVGIGASDTAWNPASTKHVISGPATLTYTQYPDGGIEVVVGEPPQIGEPRPRSTRNTAPGGPRARNVWL